MIPRSLFPHHLLLLLHLLFLLSLSSPSSSSSPACIYVDFALCDNVLLTYSTPSLVIDDGMTDLYQSILPDLLANFTRVLPILGPDCYDVAKRFMCSSLFQECLNGTEGQMASPPCQELCHEFHSECDPYLNGTSLTDALPACHTLPTANCTLAADAIPLDRSTVECPAPLIRNPDPSVERETCPGGICCLPCPYAMNFYPEGAMESTFKTIGFTIMAFSIVNLFTLAVYLIIPSKRAFPHNIVFFMASSMMLVYIAFWLANLAPKHQLLCFSEVEAPDPGKTLPLCTFQGSLLVFGLLASILWFSALGTQIFLWVFKLTMRERVKWVFHTICWVFPAIVLVVLNVEKQIGTNSAPFCRISSDAYMYWTLLIPTAVVMIPSIILVLAVYVKVALIAKSRSKSFLQVIKLQLRPLLFTTYALFIYALYLGHQVQSGPENWEPEWFYCVAMGYGQNACSEISAASVPNLPTLAAVYISLGSIGLICFMIFVMKWDVFVDLVRITTGKNLGGYGRLSSYSSDTLSTPFLNKPVKSAATATETEIETDRVASGEFQKPAEDMEVA